jgi:hypothetical protein
MNKLEDDLFQILIETAKKCRTVTYSDIAMQLNLGDLSLPEVSDQISEMLRVIAIQEHEANRPVLTTCAVVRFWHGTRPGSGFYRQMREMGRFDSPSENDKFGFHIYQLWLAGTYWSGIEKNPDYTVEQAKNDIEIWLQERYQELNLNSSNQ